MSAYPAMTLSGNGTAPFQVVTIGPTSFYGSSAAFLGMIGTVSASATLTWKVQITCDQNPSTNGNWNDHDVLKAETGSANGAQTYPITAYRLVVSGWSAGSVTLGVAQWP
jgi:hypothetical protein